MILYACMYVYLSQLLQPSFQKVCHTLSRQDLDSVMAVIGSLMDQPWQRTIPHLPSGKLT